MTSSDRDRSIEQLLRGSLPPNQGAPDADCPDAETLAALADDTLPAALRRDIEAHVADCHRCLALTAAMTRVGTSAGTTAGGAAVSWWRSRRVINWLAPAAAAATAGALLVVLPGRGTPPLEESKRTPQTQTAAAPPAAPAPAQATARDALQPPADERAENAAEGRAMKAESAVGRVAPEEPAPAALAPAPSAARSTSNEEQVEVARREDAASPAERSLGRQRASAVASLAAADRAGAQPAAGFEVVSPDPKIRWRVSPAAVVQYSADAGASWAPQQTGASVELTAGSSPAPAVCWLVGRAGTVLRTTDGGSRWQRVPFPETADLTAVVGSTALNATIDLADGRRLRTADGGQTWAPLRE